MELSQSCKSFAIIVHGGSWETMFPLLWCGVLQPVNERVAVRKLFRQDGTKRRSWLLTFTNWSIKTEPKPINSSSDIRDDPSRSRTANNSSSTSEISAIHRKIVKMAKRYDESSATTNKKG